LDDFPRCGYNHFDLMANITPPGVSLRHHTPWGAAINLDGPHSRTVRDYIHNAR
jgi:hypothetical protein